MFWIFKPNLTDLMNAKSGAVWCRFSEKISLYKITRPRYYFIFINFWLTFREVVPLAKMWKAINIEVGVKWTRLSKLENSLEGTDCFKFFCCMTEVAQSLQMNKWEGLDSDKKRQLLLISKNLSFQPTYNTNDCPATEVLREGLCVTELYH